METDIIMKERLRLSKNLNPELVSGTLALFQDSEINSE